MRILKSVASGIGVGTVLLILGCGPVKTSLEKVKRTYQKYVLRGSVVKKEGTRVTVGIGTADPKLIGRVLKVYRMEQPARESVADGSGYQSSSSPQSTRVLRGKIRITGMAGASMAEAEIIEGEVEVNDLVDLGNPAKP